MQKVLQILGRGFDRIMWGPFFFLPFSQWLGNLNLWLTWDFTYSFRCPLCQVCWTPIFNLKNQDEPWQGWSEARCAVKGLWGQPQVLRVGGQGGQCQWLPEIDLAVRRNSQSRNPNSTSAPNKDMTQPLINCQKTLKNNRLQTPQVSNNRLQI